MSNEITSMEAKAASVLESILSAGFREAPPGEFLHPEGEKVLKIALSPEGHGRIAKFGPRYEGDKHPTYNWADKEYTSGDPITTDNLTEGEEGLTVWGAGDDSDTYVYFGWGDIDEIAVE